MASRKQQDGSGGGCLAVFLVLLAIAAVLWALSSVGNVLGLTPTFSELTDRPDGWVGTHYRGVLWGYVLTVLLLITVGMVLWLAVRTQSTSDEQAAQARIWLSRSGAALGALLTAILALPIGQRPGVDTAPGQVGSAREGNVPNLIGLNASQADERLEKASLDASFEKDPLEDERCKVTDQDPAVGGEVDKYGDVKLRCDVRVPAVVGDTPDSAETRMRNAGLDVSRFTNEPSDYDLSHCRVSRQSHSGRVSPDTDITLRLKCKKPPPEPEPEPEPQPQQSNCDPNYSPCVPPYPPDLDCSDLGGTYVVTGSDPHGLDRDNDAEGCE